MTNFPNKFRPMLAKVADGPFDRENWLFEIKWDGFRALAFIHNGKVEIESRNLKSFNLRYHELVPELAKIKHSCVLDGEIVNLDKFGKSNFQALQEWQEKHLGKLEYQIFDLIYLDGHDLSEAPLVERKKILKTILPKSKLLKYCDHIENNGLAFWRQIQKEKIEGMMAKNGQSQYLKNKRSSSWLKIKNYKSREAIIIGYTDPRGGRTNFGSILVAVYKSNNLYYIGHVGTGFDQKMLESLNQKFQKITIKNPPLPQVPKFNEQVHWLKPKLVCEIKYNEMTKENILRQPAFLRLRADIDPREVHL